MKYTFAILFIIVLNSCRSGTNSRVCNTINSLISSDNRADENLEYYYNLFTKNKDCIAPEVRGKISSSENKIDKEKFKSWYRNEDVEIINKLQDIKVNLFLENSQSMWGYFKGATDCEKALSKILIHSGYKFEKENINISFITDTVMKQNIKEGFTEFIGRLEPTKLNIGNYVNSKIADIMKTVIKNTDEGEISMLVTDCIYSLEKGKDKRDGMNFEWTIIEDAFLTVLKKQDISVLVNKYISNFRGDYFSLQENGLELKREKLGVKDRFERPYYVIVFGETNLLKSALEEIKFDEYVGFQNSYFITKPTLSKEINYQIINTYKKGSFRPNRQDPKYSIDKVRKEKRGTDKGKFMYSIAANFNDISVGKDYLLDSNNYKVFADYIVQTKEITEEIERQDPSLSSFTHIISLTTNSIKTEEVSIALKRTTPAWIEETHTNEDMNLSTEYQQKTRGFKDFIEGIESAFNNAYSKKNKNDFNKKYYFKLNTKVNI